MDNLYPAAVYDRNTDGWFGRVNVYLSNNRTLAYYKVIRIHRPTKVEAMADAACVIENAQRTGEINPAVVY